MYDSILVPTDGSDGANRAIEHGLQLAERFDSTLYTLFVVDTRRYGEPALSAAELVLDDLEDRGQELLDDLVQRADNRGVDVVTHLCHGSPEEEIVAYADEIDAELLVMGYQGQSHRHDMGSVVSRVLQETDRPVLVA
jgi:nucleotide-binding universal stress UspA family protein